ncbi:hypothetical protein GC1_13040 [Leisingera sp. ANG1]|nr:hypothetical protein RA23_00875 [Leisingera sp. ANG-S3]KIC52671.1 hypothetical protein RA22_14005 [Leisingera sp. ANG-S]KID08120.1 hypothetical protein GC1_13040 [Leisingera sp. ANG1]
MVKLDGSTEAFKFTPQHIQCDPLGQIGSIQDHLLHVITRNIDRGATMLIEPVSNSEPAICRTVTQIEVRSAFPFIPKTRLIKDRAVSEIPRLPLIQMVHIWLHQTFLRTKS